jgi:glucokinase
LSGAEAVGIDLGGTKMLVGVLTEDGEVLHRREVPSTGLDQAGVLEMLEGQLRSAIEERPEVAAIGLGMPCTIDRERGLCINAVNLPLRDAPVRDIVSERLGLPTAVDNDGNLAALAEHRRGAAIGAKNVVLLTIGTGIGGGLIIDGQPYRGSSGAGAELGHIVVDIDGPRCQGSCPNRGCIEAIASGTAIGTEGARVAAAEPESALGRAAASGSAVDARLITALAKEGDDDSIAVLATIGRRLGAALSGLANVFDPDVMLLGGGAMAAGELILQPAREEFRVRALPPQNETPIELAHFGPDAGMVGAAIMALEELTPAGVPS